MKSFYEPLFPPESVDLFLCYICLHWLDSSDVHTSVSEWKAWAPATTHDQFIFMNEAAVPKATADQWRKVAQSHLAKFLALRAREMLPGAEGVLTMVGTPHNFIQPPGVSASPLTLAMQHCIQQGLLREEILTNAFVPYYTRTVDDIRDAVEMAATIPIETESEKVEYPGDLLSLVDILPYTVSVGKADSPNDNNFQGGFDMMWSIHQGAIKGAGASPAELQAIRLETRRIYDDLYDPAEGISITYVACVIRRRTRKAWS